VAGLIYQLVAFFQLNGLWTALIGFAAGFGILFILWMVGTAGGGDVKLMGALGPWMGGMLTLKVLFCSLDLCDRWNFWSRYLLSTVSGDSSYKESIHQEQSDSQRPQANVRSDESWRFAAPVALATWCVVAIQLLTNRPW
jgi:prepilin peptidase CpaA